MNAQELELLLSKEKLDACEGAREFCKGKSLAEAWNTCKRGDWMCWLFKRAGNYSLQLLTLCKGHQANTVRYLMKDERSKKAVDTAIAFGEGNATMEDLNAAAAAAYDAAAAALAAYAAYAAYDAAAAAAADAAAYAANQANQKQTADIARKYLPMPVFS